MTGSSDTCECKRYRIPDFVTWERDGTIPYGKAPSKISIQTGVTLFVLAWVKVSSNEHGRNKNMQVPCHSAVFSQPYCSKFAIIIAIAEFH
jgi:hypothetical protein